MEPEAIVAVPEDGRLSVWATSKTPFGLRDEIAASLGLDQRQVRVVVPDMGGGFGAKAGARPELVVVAAVARRLDRPLQWGETRREHPMTMTPGRGQVPEPGVRAPRGGRPVGP